MRCLYGSGGSTPSLATRFMKMWNRKGEEVEVSEERLADLLWPMRAKYPKFISKGLIEPLVPEGCLEVKDEAELKNGSVL